MGPAGVGGGPWCVVGYADCDGSGACSTFIDEDPLHCGGCGRPCSAPNVTSGCYEGRCTLAACAPGYADCNHSPLDGCEAHTVTAVENCGGCSNRCSEKGWPHVSTYDCREGQCVAKTCEAGFGHCSTTASDGCEIDLQHDAVHCGKCDTVCHTLAWQKVATYQCAAGGCTASTCATGFAHCSATASDGCELPVASDPQHCGGCNTTCGLGVPCRNGKCTKEGVLVLSDTQSGADLLRDTIVSTGVFGTIDTFNIAAATPTLAMLKLYQAVVLMVVKVGYADAARLGDRLADYFDAGGRVVLSGTAIGDLPVGGRFGDPKGSYLLTASSGSKQQSNDSLGILAEPNSPLLLNVASLNVASCLYSVVTVTGTGTAVASWKSGPPLVIRGVVNGRNRVDLNGPSIVDNNCWMGDGAALLRNALIYQ